MESLLKITIRREKEDGDEEEEVLELPGKWQVCHDCRGEGRTLTGSLRNVAYTREDFDEDPDFAEDYMNKNSCLHEQCHTCHGRTTEMVVDEERLKYVKPDVLKAYNQWLKDEDERMAEEAADRRTRMMESGGYDY